MPLLVKPWEWLVFGLELVAGVKAERQGSSVEGVERGQEFVGKLVFCCAHDGEILPHGVDEH